MFQAVFDKLMLPRAVGVIPTDTVYGLVARAVDQPAVDRLYALKHREHKPGTVIAADIDQLVALGIKRRYLQAVSQFWPGAVSVILPVSGIDYLHQGLQSLAVRVVADPELQTLLQKTGPLLSSSANLPGEPTATTVAAAKACFHDQVDFYIDGGDLSNRQPSTIIRIIDDAIEIVRQGSVEVTLDT